MNLKAGAEINDGEAVSLTDRLLVELEGTKRFVVTERAARDSILKEVAFQQTGACDEASCLAQIGKLLGVQKMVGGSVGKVGNTYTVSLRMVDVETGRIDRTAFRDYQGTIDVLLKAGMREVAWDLTREAAPTVPPSVRHSQAAKRRWGWMTLSLGVASTVGGMVFKAQADGDYKKYRSAQTVAEMNDFKQKTKSMDNLSVALFGVSGACVLTSGVLFLSSRGGGEKAEVKGGTGVYLGFVQPCEPGAVLVLRF
jgi:hypothetical protein